MRVKLNDTQKELKGNKESDDDDDLQHAHFTLFFMCVVCDYLALSSLLRDIEHCVDELLSLEQFVLRCEHQFR
jgi:hypothetical protein